MMRGMSLAFLVMALFSERPISPSNAPVLSVCELSKHLPRYNNQVVTVRGVYYYGLRQECPQKCATEVWPSFIALVGKESSDPETARRNAEAFANLHRQAEDEAKRTGKRFEIWVTVTGELHTHAQPRSFVPCDRKSWGMPGYGHLGVYPAEIVAEGLKDIEVKENPRSPYDYANMYHGPA
jgi:hypothetical protein